MIILPAGTTQLRLVVGLFDASGAALTGKVAATMQIPVLSLIGGSAPGTLSLSNLASATTAFSAGGMFELGAGRYRLDITMSGATQAINICAEGTVGSLIADTIVVTDSTSNYLGSNVLTVNGSSAPAAALSLVTNDSNGWLKTSPQLNALLASWVNATDSSAATAHFLALSAAITLIDGYAITVNSPVLSASSIELVKGDDYLNADSRALTFSFTSIPSLTSGTVTLHNKYLTVQGVVTSASACRFELRAAQTGKLFVGSTPFAVVATLSDGSTCTLTTGNLLVKKNP